VVVLAVVLNVVGDTVVPVLLDDVVVSAVSELSETDSVELTVVVYGMAVVLLVIEPVVAVKLLVCVPLFQLVCEVVCKLVVLVALVVLVLVPVCADVLLVLLVSVVFVLVVTSYTTMVQALVSAG
jgi:hypothetical protein